MGRIRFFGAIIILSLIIQAAYFGDVKSMFGDSAFTVFKILNFESIPVEHDRYAGAIVNIPAYLGMYFDAPISLIFKLYAIGPWLLILGVFSLLVYLKRPVESLTLVISLVWFMRESFFITTEVPAAVSFSLLFSVFLWWQNNNQIVRDWRPVLIGLLGVIGAVFSHPIGLILVSFLLVLKFTDSIKEFRKWWYFAIPLLIVILLKSAFFSTSSYEESFYTKLFKDITWVQGFTDLYSVQFFFKAQNGMYLLLILLWILALFRLNTNEARPTFLFSLIGLPVLWVLVMVTFKEGDVNPMMEKSYLAIVMPVVFVFIFRSYQLYKGIGGMVFLSFWVISLISISNIAKIGNDVYAKRLNRLEKLVTMQQRTGHDKFYVEKAQIKGDVWLTHWALPFETLLMSLEKNGVGKLTVLDMSTRNLPNLNSHQYYGPDWFGAWDVNTLNKKYFSLSKSEWVKIGSLDFVE